MILSRYEETVIKNASLPPTWRSQRLIDELEEFLQNNWEQRSIFYDDNTIETHQQFLSFTSNGGIRTKKYIGTIVYGGEQLNIYPKMFRTEADDHDTDNLTQDHLMKNLIQWLEYCNRITYPFINISTELQETNDLRELFITLYVAYVNSAIERGQYYQYIEETEDISHIKGKFDYSDYIVKKLPNGMGNKFRCTYSNFEHDNWVNRIIKSTCKQLLNSTSKRNQAIIRRILVKLNNVLDIQCSPSDCDRVHLNRMSSNYRIIISMSKMFLLNKTSALTMDINESFCFLFPTDLLFEGFIGGFIQETLEQHGGKVRIQQSDMYLIDDIQYAGESLGAAFTMRHDIVVDLNDKKYILDTKYKQISRFEGDNATVRRVVSEEPKQMDIYQVCEYARKRNVSDVYLLYPLYRYEGNEPHFPVGKSQGDSGDINIHFIRLPFVFENDIDATKKQLSDVIKTIFGV